MPITLQGRSLGDFSLALLPPFDNWFHTPRVDRTSESVVDYMASRPNTRARTEPRDLVLHTLLRADTIEEREAKQNAIADWLTGIVRITRMDSATKVVRAEYLGATVEAFASATHFVLPSLKLSLQFRAYDAASYDISPTIIALTTTPTPIIVGTLPSLGVITMPGGWSGSRVLVYRGANGIVYGSLTIFVPATDTFAAGEHLRIDLARWRVTRVSASGVRTNVYHWLTGGDWFAPNATDVDRSRGMYPSLAMSAGTAQYRHRLAWRF
jgi:hypothetical protein